MLAINHVEKVLETVVETFECVVEVVEKVAEEVEKLADEVADALPENGKLKEAVCWIEKVAKETAKDARIAEELIKSMKRNLPVFSVFSPLCCGFSYNAMKYACCLKKKV